MICQTPEQSEADVVLTYIKKRLSALILDTWKFLQNFPDFVNVSPKMMHCADGRFLILRFMENCLNLQLENLKTLI